MTLGAILLTVLQTNPIRPPLSPARISDTQSTGAAEAVFDTNVPIQPTKWHNIVIHGEASENRNVADQCHFVIGSSGTVVATGRWKQQISGQHVSTADRDWNDDSIGVCLLGDLDTQGPTRSQYRALLALTATLQRHFNSSADHVYLYRHLNVRTRSPGEMFPAEDFATRLLRPAR